MGHLKESVEMDPFDFDPFELDSELDEELNLNQFNFGKYVEDKETGEVKFVRKEKKLKKKEEEPEDNPHPFMPANLAKWLEAKTKHSRFKYNRMNFVALDLLKKTPNEARIFDVVTPGNTEQFQLFYVICVEHMKEHEIVMRTVDKYVRKLVREKKTTVHPGFDPGQLLVFKKNRKEWRRGLVIRNTVFHMGREDVVELILDIDRGELVPNTSYVDVRNMDNALFKLPVYTIPVRFSIQKKTWDLVMSNPVANDYLGKALHNFLHNGWHRGLRMKFHRLSTEPHPYHKKIWVVDAILCDIVLRVPIPPQLKLGYFFVRLFLDEWTPSELAGQWEHEIEPTSNDDEYWDDLPKVLPVKNSYPWSYKESRLAGEPHAFGKGRKHALEKPYVNLESHSSEFLWWDAEKDPNGPSWSSGPRPLRPYCGFRKMMSPQKFQERIEKAKERHQYWQSYSLTAPGGQSATVSSFEQPPEPRKIETLDFIPKKTEAGTEDDVGPICKLVNVRKDGVWQMVWKTREPNGKHDFIGFRDRGTTGNSRREFRIQVYGHSDLENKNPAEKGEN